MIDCSNGRSEIEFFNIPELLPNKTLFFKVYIGLKGAFPLKMMIK